MEEGRREEELGDTPVWKRRLPLLTTAGYGFLAFSQILLDEIIPLFTHGCLGFNSQEIGSLLAVGGVSILLISFATSEVSRRTQVTF